MITDVRHAGEVRGRVMQRDKYAGIAGRAMWTRHGIDALQTWVHTPEDERARGLVLLAPPVGREHVQAYRSHRQLAMLLAGEGYCVARACYRGVGDSHGLDPQDDVVAAWRQDLLDTAAHARQVCGTEHLPVWAIGHRIGAALLAGIAERFDHVIAWEPVGGSVFVKQWSRLRNATLPDIPVGDRVDLMGLCLATEQAAQLSTLRDPHRIKDLPEHVTVFREKDQPRAKVMYGVESLDTRVHYDVLDHVIRMLPRPEPDSIEGTGHGPLRNEFTSTTGVECAEEIVRVEPKDYMGVLTGPVVADKPHRPIASHEGKPVTFYAPGASEPRDGSALWSETARVLAGHGVASLRADRDGAADRAELWADRDPNPYRHANAQAMREQAQWLNNHFKANVVATVLCSGAWDTLCAAREPQGIPVEGMILINQNEWRMKQEFFDELRKTYDADARLHVAARTSQLAKEELARPATPRRDAAKKKVARAASSATAVLGTVKEKGSYVLRRYAPEPAWNLIARCPEASVADHTLKRASRNARVILLVGPQDEPRYRETLTPRAVARLRARGRDIREEFLPHVDHSILSRTARDVVIARVVELLSRWEGRSPTNG